MYEFVETTQQAISNLSSFAISLNGQILEEAIPDFKTLTVEGREIIGNELNIDTAPGLNGAVLISSGIPPRYVDVKYQISSKTEDDLKASFKKLELLLFDYRRKANPFSFADEPSLEYQGLLLDNELLTENNQLTLKGVLKFICLNPYKRSDLKTFVCGLGQGDSHEIANGWYALKLFNKNKFPIEIESMHLFRNGHKPIEVLFYNANEHKGIVPGDLSTLPREVSKIKVAALIDGITLLPNTNVLMDFKTCQITDPKNKDKIYNEFLDPGSTFDLRLNGEAVIIVKNDIESQVVIKYRELSL